LVRLELQGRSSTSPAWNSRGDCQPALPGIPEVIVNQPCQDFQGNHQPTLPAIPGQSSTDPACNSRVIVNQPCLQFQGQSSTDPACNSKGNRQQGSIALWNRPQELQRNCQQAPPGIVGNIVDKTALQFQATCATCLTGNCRVLINENCQYYCIVTHCRNSSSFNVTSQTP